MATTSGFTSSSQLSASQRNTWEPRTAHAQTTSDDDDDLGAFDEDEDPSLIHTRTNGHPMNGHAPLPFPPRQSSLEHASASDPLRNPRSIALRAAFLSLILGITIPSTLLPLSASNPLWRLPFFAATLALFHLLEFFSTAIANPAAATTRSFLLDNGTAYNIAHLSAFLECFLQWTLFQTYRPVAVIRNPFYISLGCLLMLAGQSIRTIAMLHAGPNFTHVIANTKKSDHALITSGIYAYLRHPSYFGFFWWGIGGQMVLGNMACLVGFTVVLWRFFSRRIVEEEGLLVRFFGEGYVRYRRKTRVGIPFIP